MERYKFFKDITSDILFEAYGSNPNEVFENAALALSSVICQIDKVHPLEVKEIEIKGENIKDLLFEFLQEIIALVDIEEMFFSRFEVDISDDEKSLKAKCSGEPITPEKGGTVVKSLTYHQFSFEKKGKNYKAKISCDI